jgi:hypothetical protein
MKIKTKNKIKKVFGFIFKNLVKIGLSTAAITAPTNPISAGITGIGVLASVVASLLSDTKKRNEGKGKLAKAGNIVRGVYELGMKVNNLVACNMDKASNDKRKNK